MGALDSSPRCLAKRRFFTQISLESPRKENRTPQSRHGADVACTGVPLKNDGRALAEQFHHGIAAFYHADRAADGTEVLLPGIDP